MAQVYASKRGKYWRYRFEAASVEGTRKEFTKSGYRTKKDALLAGNRALAEYQDCGTLHTRAEMSYADYLDYWMENYCHKELSALTCDGYEKRIRNYIKPALGAFAINALSTEAIQSFLNSTYHAGYSRNTIVSLKGIISGSFHYAVVTAKVVKYNPAQGVRLPSKRVQPKVKTRSRQRDALSLEEVDLILHRFPYGSSSHLPLLFAYRCGLRLGEAYAVMWSDIDFVNATLRVNRQAQYLEKTITFLPPKYDSYREIRLDPHMVEILQLAHREQSEHRHKLKENYTRLYVSSNGNTLNHGPLITDPELGSEVFLVTVREDGSYIRPRTMQHCSRIIHNDLGLPNFDFHSLRHTHATMLAERGALAKDIQNRLGHKNIAVTMEIYTHLTPSMESIGIDILGQIPIPRKEKPKT